MPSSGSAPGNSDSKGNPESVVVRFSHVCTERLIPHDSRARIHVLQLLKISAALPDGFVALKGNDSYTRRIGCFSLD